MPIVYLVVLVFLIFLLVKSADLIENGIVVLAKKLGISTFVIGFVVVSLASSLPEISVALNSLTEEVPGLSVGNLIGATIVLTTLVLALNVFKSGKLPFRGSFGVRELELAAVVLIAQVILLLDRRLGFIDGLIMLALYLSFTAYVTIHGRTKHKLQVSISQGLLQDRTLFLKVGLGLVGLIICSRWIVDLGVSLANDLSIPPAIVGLLVLGLGTNLPEITILFRAHNLDSRKLAVGNLIGSATVNTATLGLLGVLYPYDIPNYSILHPALLILGGVLVMVVILANTGNEISKKEGYIMIGMYLSFLITQIILLSRI